MIRGYRDRPDICGRCKGACCKSVPGAAIPEDFDNDEVKVVLALASGRWCVDRLGFVRPAVHGQRGQLYAEGGGRCNFLSSKGCLLPYKERPVWCRTLKPYDDFGCQQHGPDIMDVLDAWRPWRCMLEDLGVEEFDIWKRALGLLGIF